MRYREATQEDIPVILEARQTDLEWGPADHRTGLYLKGEHHPQQALLPRVIIIALDGEALVGYIGGHLTTRYECDGELQYLWVAPEQRRRGVASGLLRLLTDWFAEREAKRICVDVSYDNMGARAFYADRGAVKLVGPWLVWEDLATE